MSPEDENKEKETLAFTVRYRTADLKRLSILAKSTQIVLGIVKSSFTCASGSI